MRDNCLKMQFKCSETNQDIVQKWNWDVDEDRFVDFVSMCADFARALGYPESLVEAGFDETL